MDLIYADAEREEQGILINSYIDFDTTGTKDFEIRTSIDNRLLQQKYYWWIEGTEYGGRVDDITISTEGREYICHGRNWRGILDSKIIKPPQGQSHKKANGTISDCIRQLITECGLAELFEVEDSLLVVRGFKYNRYISVYEGIVSLCKIYGFVPSFVCERGKVKILISMTHNYAEDKEYFQEDLNFEITKVSGNVNHLVCLGKGELTERVVIDLYADIYGNITQTQTITGIDEITEVYENTSDEYDQLLQDGIKHFQEITNTDSFEVTVPEHEYNVGDVIGGYEEVTQSYVAKEITNIILKMSDEKTDIDYEVGDKGEKIQGSIEGNNYTFYVTPEGDLYETFVDKSVKARLSFGVLIIDTTEQLRYDERTGDLFVVE